MLVLHVLHDPGISTCANLAPHDTYDALGRGFGDHSEIPGYAHPPSRFRHNAHSAVLYDLLLPMYAFSGPQASCSWPEAGLYSFSERRGPPVSRLQFREFAAPQPSYSCSIGPLRLLASSHAISPPYASCDSFGRVFGVHSLPPHSLPIRPERGIGDVRCAL